ncbi:GDSL-type esterase/lipase family protein [Rhodococcus tukisamuensis]|uniref:Lysophospholipase L1 n=1 Tax=Rhodococcus tukisamuensis TaxID=168276 RepID=A0A1G7BE91_9NOCA|nr:GDSL-type esterase/lipase family protein [Rhodococcus tukisamuensis]SDE25331.1 Lysophospholipase L1 [Rhodococcus tukisamuensis]
MTERKIRICFFGDSFVAGVGDPRHLGWVGRVAVESEKRGLALTEYNLGIRMDTSTDVRTRWFGEATSRFPSDLENRIVLSIGVNDTTANGGGTRVDPDTSVQNLTHILDTAAAARWPVLVVGPPPIDDREQNLRTAALGERFAAACHTRGVTFVDAFGALADDPVWQGPGKVMSDTRWTATSGRDGARQDTSIGAGTTVSVMIQVPTQPSQPGTSRARSPVLARACPSVRHRDPRRTRRGSYEAPSG